MASRLLFSSPVKRGSWIVAPSMLGATRPRGRKAAGSSPADDSPIAADYSPTQSETVSSQLLLPQLARALRRAWLSVRPVPVPYFVRDEA